MIDFTFLIFNCCGLLSVYSRKQLINCDLYYVCLCVTWVHAPCNTMLTIHQEERYRSWQGTRSSSHYGRACDGTAYWMFVYRDSSESQNDDVIKWIFRVTGPLCGDSPVTGEFATQRPVTWSFDVLFDLRLYKRLSVPYFSVRRVLYHGCVNLLINCDLYGVWLCVTWVHAPCNTMLTIHQEERSWHGTRSSPHYGRFVGSACNNTACGMSSGHCLSLAWSELVKWRQFISTACKNIVDWALWKIFPEFTINIWIFPFKEIERVVSKMLALWSGLNVWRSKWISKSCPTNKIRLDRKWFDRCPHVQSEDNIR